jgi:gluconate 2-dehydrogenase gamma chain
VNSNEMTRREAVATMAATAGAFAIPVPQRTIVDGKIVSRVAPHVPGTAYTPKVYTAHEYATVSMLVDIIIPKDAKSGSATDAGVPEFMDTMLDLEPTMRAANRGGLAWLDHVCLQRHGKAFIDCTPAQRTALLDDIAFPARTRPDLAAGAAWFSSFRDFTATGFFSSEMGVTDIGYMGNTPVMEWTGCPTEAYTRLGATKS